MLTATGDLADSLVESDGSGNITANVTGNLTGNVTGNADTATTAANLSGSNLAGDVTNSGNTITIAANTIGNSELDTSIGSGSSWSIGVGATQVIPAGIVNYVHTSGGAIQLELFVSGSWRRALSTSVDSGCVFSDGTNMRLYATTATATVYYQVIA